MRLGERDRPGDEARVERVEDDGGGDDAGQVGGARGRSGRRGAGRPLSAEHEARDRDRDDVLRGVEGDALRRLAADPVSEDRAEREGDGGRGGAVTDEQREREGVRRGHLALGGAQDHLERGELGDHGAAHEEQQQLGVASVEKIESARRDERDQAERATRHDGDDIARERLGGHGSVSCSVAVGTSGGERDGCPNHGSGTRCIYHLRPCLTVGPRRISDSMTSST